MFTLIFTLNDSVVLYNNNMNCYGITDTVSFVSFSVSRSEHENLNLFLMMMYFVYVLCCYQYHTDQL